MNIVQVARRFVRDDWGGVETSILETCKQLVRRGHATEIVTSAALAKAGVEDIAGVPVTRHRYFYPYWGLTPDARLALDKKGGNLFSLSLMNWLRRRPGVDLLHTHTINRLGGIVRHVARKRNLPYVVSIHGGVHDIPPDQTRQLLQPTRGAIEWGKALGWWVGSRRVLQDASAIICFGQREYELTRQRLPGHRVARLPHGVDIDHFRQGDGARFRAQLGIPNDARVLLCVARIDPQKDQLLAVNALPALLAAEPCTMLVLLGPVTCEEYRRQLLDAARESGCSERLIIAPGLDPADPALVDAYHGADLFVLPSAHEVFGIVVLEAWAAGLPVVASDVGGLASLVRHGEDGLLMPAGSQQEFVRLCAQLLLDHELHQSLRTTALERVRREFGWDQVTSQLESIYEEVVHDTAIVH